MLFGEQLAGEIHESAKSSTPSSRPAVTALIRRRAAPRCCWVRSGDSGSGVEQLGEGGDEGVLNHVGSKYRVARHDQRRQALPISLVEPDDVAHSRNRHRGSVSQDARD